MRQFLLLLLVIFYSNCHPLTTQNSDLVGSDEPARETLSGTSSDSIIYLNNSSFENGKHGHSTLPEDWFHCIDGNTPPDLHDSWSNYFGISKSAMNGKQFVGMVVREDNTFENISQRLPLAFQKGTTYEMEFSLAQAKELLSMSRTSIGEVNFNTPVILQIWGGFNYCESNQLLYESIAITHQIWKDYTAKFTADDNYEVITFEAFYSDAYNPPYNGHLLLDHLSPIIQVSE